MDGMLSKRRVIVKTNGDQIPSAHHNGTASMRLVQLHTLVALGRLGWLLGGGDQAGPGAELGARLKVDPLTPVLVTADEFRVAVGA